MKRRAILLVAVIFLVISIGLIIYFLKGRDEQTLDTNENLEGDSGNMDDSELTIKLDINGVSYVATLIDNVTTRELLNRLPLTITMNELNGNEKYYYFDEIFPSNPNRVEEIYMGDIMLYWNNCLVLFYDNFQTSYRYTKIGSIDYPGDLREIVGSENVNVTIYK